MAAASLRSSVTVFSGKVTTTRPFSKSSRKRTPIHTSSRPRAVLCQAMEMPNILTVRKYIAIRYRLCSAEPATTNNGSSRYSCCSDSVKSNMPASILATAAAKRHHSSGAAFNPKHICIHSNIVSHMTMPLCAGSPSAGSGVYGTSGERQWRCSSSATRKW